MLFTSRPGAVIPKDDLIDTVWRGVAVTTNSLDHVVSALRRRLCAP
ncbi:MAG TPA: winged helix-turn-helix domain-containing protein [Vicinamibacterales bacterium]